MSDRPAAFPDDPDVQHLLRLLAILPGSDDVAFWNQVDAHGFLSEEEATAENPRPSGDGYLLAKMAVHIRAALSARAHGRTFESLAGYTLMFFYGDHPGLWKALESRVQLAGFNIEDGIGRRYAEELCDTALRVATRYNQDYRGSAAELLAKWPEPNRMERD